MYNVKRISEKNFEKRRLEKKYRTRVQYNIQKKKLFKISSSSNKETIILFDERITIKIFQYRVKSYTSLLRENSIISLTVKHDNLVHTFNRYL